MASAKDGRKLVIRRVKKVQGGGHHGGSWKVAYADFVTAMMAFFMVMWILGMSAQARSSIESYFSNPAGLKQGYSGGNNPLGAGFSATKGGGVGKLRLISRAQERREMMQMGERIRARIRSSDGLREIAAQVEVTMSEQGLRIELVETGKGETFFAFGDATVKPATRRALEVIASELKTGDEPVVIEGHTDSAPFSRGHGGYTNWELSADRANAARRALESAGVAPEQVREVRGYADRHPRVAGNLLDPTNRRISILLPFSSAAPSAPGAEGAPEAQPKAPEIPKTAGESSVTTT
ncbi:MAG: OmpA family protein [Gemmatimonadetes bacterium]|nr:OmpA family protein [Gemmatimonadota bacterium]